MVCLAAVVFGYFSIQRLPVTLMPELSYPTLTVRTEYAGSAPEEVENEISRPIEEALGVVSGLNRISSISRAGLSDVVLEFVWGTDMSEATQNTLEKLDLVFLPSEAQKPLLLHFDPSLDPIMELSLSGHGRRFEGEQGLRRLRRLAELQIKRVLEPIKGVAAVRVRGGLEEEIHVLVSEQNLTRTGLTIQHVIDRLRQENINVAGGTIKEGRAEYMVRTLNEYENLDQIEETVVQRIEGKEIRVKDLGRVVRSHKEREILTKTDGLESVQIDIYKEADANMVAVAKNVIGVLGEIRDESKLPTNPPVWSRLKFFNKPKRDGLATLLWRDEKARLEVVADRSVFIEKSIQEVRSNAVLGGVLAVFVLYLFLCEARSTVIIGLSIPISLLITFAPLNLLHVSLNIMSLGGLALGVGMLVDSSIVVLESIFRCREEGDDIVTAAIRGTREVGGAVWSSTLTTVAVFFPMVFVEGIAGQVFGDLAWAVVISLIASTLVAIYFIPMLVSRQPPRLGGGAGSEAEVEGGGGWNSIFTRWVSWTELKSAWDGPANRWRGAARVYWVFRFILAAVFEVVGKILLGISMLLTWLLIKILGGFLKAIGEKMLTPLLGLAKALIERLQWRYGRLIESALDSPSTVLLGVASTFAALFLIGKQLDTELLPEVHQGEFTFELNLPVGTPLEETDAALAQVEKTILSDKKGIKSLLVTLGYDVTNMKRSDEGEHSARFKVLLQPGKDPVAEEARVLARLRPLFAQIPGLSERVTRPVLFSSKAPIVVEIRGDDLARLKQQSERVKDVLSKLPGLADVETSLKSGAPEIEVVYDRERLIRTGLNIQQVAKQVRDRVKGFEATRFNMRDRRIPILVRLDEGDRERIEDVSRLTVNGGGDQPILLGSVAELKVGEGPSEVRRIDRRRMALVDANIASGSLGTAVEAIKRALGSQIEWPAEMGFAITGQNEEWEKSRGSLFLALGLSVFLVYVIMAAQFESLMQPLIIMLTIPLGFIGAFVALQFLGMPVSVMVLLGLIILVGIVVNNAIVLVDYVNTLRSRGMPRREALVTAGKVRLRPILMTTGTTVLGLIPMALGLGDGAEIRMPMAVTVMAGLTSSTILTLVVIPTVYDRIDAMLERWLKRDLVLDEERAAG